MWAGRRWATKTRRSACSRIDPDGKGATRVPVKVGRASVNSIQVLEGLKEGDTVILSDMSRWDNVDRIRLE
jgi:HlyD family secretion protein